MKIVAMAAGRSGSSLRGFVVGRGALAGSVAAVLGVTPLISDARPAVEVATLRDPLEAASRTAIQPRKMTSEADPNEVALLFSGLEGRWSCSGAFANGKPLRADLSFTRSADRRTLRYVHVDRAPNSYRQDSVWGIDEESKHLVSLAFTNSGAAMPSAAMYIAETVKADRVELVHRRLLTEPFAPNRFIYSLPKPNTLNMVWEVYRAGGWRWGDHLECDRVRTSS